MGVGSVSQALVVVEAARLSTRQVHYVCGAVREFACRSAVCVLFMMWWRSIRSNYGICWGFFVGLVLGSCVLYIFLNVLLDFYIFLKYSRFFSFFFSVFLFFLVSFLLWFRSFIDYYTSHTFYSRKLLNLLRKKKIYLCIFLLLFISIHHSFRPRIKKKERKITLLSPYSSFLITPP